MVIIAHFTFGDILGNRILQLPVYRITGILKLYLQLYEVGN